MKPDTEKVAKEISDRVYAEAMKVVQSVPGWSSLKDSDQERVKTALGLVVDGLQYEFTSAVERQVDFERAKGNPYFVGTEMRIAMKDAVTEVLIATTRPDAPAELYDHAGSYLVILTNKRMTLEEFDAQEDLIDAQQDGQDGSS